MKVAFLQRPPAEDLVTAKVAVLGTGIMGAGMAQNLIKAGLDVTVWNRNPERARPLVDAGARAANDAAEAVAGADVVVTMLFDADATAEVMEWALPAVAPEAVWVQTGTVGLDGTARLAALAQRHGVAFLDAPVLGTRQPAEQGTLTVLVGGPEALREKVAPVLDAIASRTIWVGEHPGDGHKLKLVANSYVAVLTAATAQAMALAEGLGLDPALFLDTLAGGSLDSAYLQLKARSILAGEYPTSFSVGGAAKDSGLIAAAMRDAGVDSGVMQAVRDAFRRADDAGHGDKDMAAVVHAFRPPA
jgi:3-hydroxyisobutyrate dehydrogenase